LQQKNQIDVAKIRARAQNLLRYVEIKRHETSRVFAGLSIRPCPAATIG